MEDTAELEVEKAALGFPAKLAKLKDLFKRLNRGPTELVAIDVGTSGIKAVRMRKTAGGAEVSGADILPMPQAESADEEETEVATPQLSLPPELKARHAVLCTTAADSIVKLLSFPGAFNEQTEAQIVTSLGIEDEDAFRVGYEVVMMGQGRSESVVLAVAMPNAAARAPLALVASGLPVPYSVEISGLCAMNAFLAGPGAETMGEFVGAIEFGATVSFFALFKEGRLVLIRKFNFGMDPLIAKVRDLLTVDTETARNILTDGSFDLSQPIGEIMQPFIKQLVISRDFVERRYNGSVTQLFLSGGAVGSQDWVTELQNAFGLDVNIWNPFDVVSVDDSVDLGRFAGQESRFAAAIGAGLATFEDT